MSRPIRVLLILLATVAAATAVAACGTEKLKVSKADPTYQGAVLFSQRCSGCHTLSYAGTHGSADNQRTREAINGPNFNVRCERPISRVLYAIENGGFSGAYMPQNIVVGQQAAEVARFVSKFAGRRAVYQPGTSSPPCFQQKIGTLPAPTATTATTSAPATTAGTPAAATTTTPAAKTGKPAAKTGKHTAKTAKHAAKRRKRKK